MAAAAEEQWSWRRAADCEHRSGDAVGDAAVLDIETVSAEVMNCLFLLFDDNLF